MNFRDSKNLRVKIISAFTSGELQSKVNKFCDGLDVIDLQYSTHAMSSWSGSVTESWSVFIIYRGRKDDKNL